MQGVVPEIHEPADAVWGIDRRTRFGHLLGSGWIPKKYRDTQGVPGVKMIGLRISLSGRQSDGLCWTVSPHAGGVRGQLPAL